MSNTAPSPVLSPLLIEHAHADHEVAALTEAVKSQDKPAIRACVGALERALLQHFDAEERELFVFYRQREPQEVRKLEQEHAELRALLGNAGDLAALGAFGAGELRSLKLSLTMHHAHEETGIYRWAQQRTLH